MAGGVNATTSKGGKGALIAVAIVPSGDVVMVSGTIRGDSGGDFAISATNPIPEPAGIALLLIGGAGLTRRRRSPGSQNGPQFQI